MAHAHVPGLSSLERLPRFGSACGCTNSNPASAYNHCLHGYPKAIWQMAIEWDPPSSFLLTELLIE